TLGFYRVLQAAIGGGLGAFAQLALWPDDPLVWLRRSLSSQLAAAEAGLAGGRVVLDAARVAPNFEVLANALMLHPGLGRRRPEISALVVDVGCVVDATLRHQVRSGAPSPALREALDDARRRFETAELFTPPPAPPAPPPAWFWRDALQETMQ